MKKLLGSLAALIILATSGLVFGAEKTMPLPDFTKGDKPDASAESYSLHLGARGIPNSIQKLDKDGQIYVCSVSKDHQNGPLQVGDVILGVNDTLFTGNVIETLRAAVAAAPKRSKEGKLSVIRWRKGVRETVDYIFPVVKAPDLTVAANRFAVDRSFTYNLGPTGMRGWIWTQWETYNSDTSTAGKPWQILVTSVGKDTPAAAAGILPNDVILGVKAGGGAVSLFTKDARKSLGLAIGDAEAANGVLKLLINREGVATNQTYTLQLKLTNLAYSATAPYNCPKSARILADAVKVISNKPFKSSGIANQVLGLAKLAAGITNDELKTYAHSMCPATGSLQPRVSYSSWSWAYANIFLTEYFLMTGDTSVKDGILEWSRSLAEAQDMYGMMGHYFTENRHDGTHGSAWGYGPMHACSIPAGVSLVLAKKCGIVHPELDPAIDRLGKYESYYVDKGGLPYGEHAPELQSYRANGGRHAMAAMFFGLQGNKPTQTEYFTRMNMAEYNGMECWHCGGDPNYIWGWIAANLGGTKALASRFEQMRWYVDLARRCDGSFVSDAYDQGFDGVKNGDYWDPNLGYQYELDATSLYVLLFSVPDRRIYLTGRNPNPANELSAAAVSNAIWAGHLESTVNGYTTNQLLGYFGEYDPCVRWSVAQTLAAKPDSANLVPKLIEMTNNADPRVREASCQALGTIKNPAAIPALVARLRDPDMGVRWKAGGALQGFDAAATTAPYLTDIMKAFIANGSLDQYSIDWADPLREANNRLSALLFNQRPGDTLTAPTDLLYEAVKVGLAQPDGAGRGNLARFLDNLTWTDVQTLAPNIVEAAKDPPPADRMFGADFPIYAINTLAKHNVAEGIPLAVRIADKYVLYNGIGQEIVGEALKVLSNTYRGSAKEALPALHTMASWAPDRWTKDVQSAIHSIQTNPGPALVNFKKITTITATPPALKWPAATAKLACSVTDLNKGIPRYHWSKLSGDGTVTFSVNDSTAASTCTATFSAPGTYVLQVACDDGSILDSTTWNWGYQPEGSKNYTHIIGAVYGNITVKVE
jgi:hypothetical protein